jgi:GNAT superfamily N-acetyltransferase
VATRIIKLSQDSPQHYYPAIAQIHLDSIHHGALPYLGKKFLARLYYEFARAKRSGVWAAVEDDRVTGFLAGCADVKACFRSVLLRGLIPLGLRAMGSIFRPQVWRKAPSLILYPFRSNQNEAQKTSSPHAEILAIAVTAETRGKGIGRLLIAAFEVGLRDWECSGEYRVTTNSAEVVSNKFYVNMGFEPCGTVRHHSLVLQEYRKSVGKPMAGNRNEVSG